MKKLFFLFFLLTTPIAAHPIVWHEGSVVLASGKVLTGKITLESAFDLVLLRTSATDSCLVLPAHKVLSLYFHDAGENINRKFVSLKEDETDRAPQRFYEVVLYGKVNVVRRGRCIHPSDDAQDYVYFVQRDNTLTKLRQFKKDIYPALQASAGKGLEEFVASSKLDPANAAQAIRIIEYYNHIVMAGALAKH